ncbi:MAG: antibiotic biosynthesis monooxygenase [Gammaproteobacteria bacterium]
MVTIPCASDGFTVQLVFETHPDEAEAFARRLLAFVSERLPRHGGFMSAVVYVSDDQRRVVELLQWARPEDWAAYRSSVDGRAGLAWLQDRHPGVQYLELVGAVLGSGPVA